MAKRTQGGEGPTDEPILDPRVDHDALLAFGDGRTEEEMLTTLTTCRRALDNVLARTTPDTITGERAAALFLRGEVSVPDGIDAVQQVRDAVRLLIHETRLQLRERVRDDAAFALEQRCDEILEGQRQQQHDLLARYGADGLPRIDAPRIESDRAFKTYARMTRMFSRREDRIVTEHDANTQRPPLPEVQRALWHEGFVIDPDRMSPELMLPYEFEEGDTALMTLNKTIAQIPTLKGMLADATPLETPRGDRTRVLVLHGEHGGQPLDGCMLVTRTRADTGDAEAPELVAYMSRNALRVQRERTHLVEGSREEAELFEALAVEATELYREYPGWKSYARDEQDELGKNVLAFFHRVDRFLGAPHRRKLDVVQAMRPKVQKLLRNPGATMATIRRSPEIFGELAVMGRSRSSTVRVEQDALADEISRARTVRERGIAWAQRILEEPHGHPRSQGKVVQSLEMLLQVVTEYRATLQPFAAVQEAVLAIASDALRLASEEGEGWREAFVARVHALDALFRGEQLVEEIENTLRILSPQKRRTRSAGDTGTQEAGRRALARVDALTAGHGAWLAVRENESPLTYTRREATDALGTLENHVVEARAAHPAKRPELLRSALNGFDVQKWNDRIADAVFVDLGLPRTPAPGRGVPTA